MKLLPLPPRAALLLPPQAPTSGSKRESLSSVARRTAEANQLSIATLVRHVLLPWHSNTYRGLSGLRGFSHRVNGDAEVAHQCGHALGVVTQPFDYLKHTLAHLAQLRGFSPLVCSKQKKWCPRCYEEDCAEAHGPYDRLLWCLDEVEVCPEHLVALSNSCAICGKGNFPPLQGRDVSGHCSACRGWLGGKGKEIQPSRNEHERYLVWTAQSCAQLLDECFDEPIEAKENVAGMMQAIIEHHFEGVALKFANAIGRTKSSVSGWTRQNFVPRLDVVLNVSYAFHVPLVGFLRGDRDAIPMSSPRNLPYAVTPRAKTRKVPRVVTQDEVFTAIDQLQQGNWPSVISLRALGQRMNSTAKYLAESFPEDFKTLKAMVEGQATSIREAQRRRRQQNLRQEIIHIAAGLAGSGLNISRRRLIGELSRIGMSLRREEIVWAVDFAKAERRKVLSMAIRDRVGIPA